MGFRIFKKRKAEGENGVSAKRFGRSVGTDEGLGRGRPHSRPREWDPGTPALALVRPYRGLGLMVWGFGRDAFVRRPWLAHQA
ncbi:MAG: hypothetical protein EBT57_10850 [Verrucomicrobia bacterium]|nr:hypothetical protein [Verrucomicrobiota bacterium]